jgi:CheY-like chemotaxis protein
MMKKILLVEDDLYNRELYKEILDKAGYDVTALDDGEKAYRQILLGGFDLIILDVMLPKIDGLTIVKMLKDKTPDKPNGPVIFLTNLAQDKVLKEAQTFGVVDCLTKTDFNPEQLISKIRGYLKE